MTITADASAAAGASVSPPLPVDLVTADAQGDRLVLAWKGIVSSLDDFDWTRSAVEGLTRYLSEAAPAGTGAAQIDRITALERLVAAAQGALMAEEVAFAEGQLRQQKQDQVPARQLGRGIAEQIGFARGIAPAAAAHHLATARALQNRLPDTYARLRLGEVSADRAQIVATRTSHLSELNAGIVDAALAPSLDKWNRRQTEQAVNHLAQQVDLEGFVDRRAQAERDRRVSTRPLPDTMVGLTAVLPVAQGIAAFAALRKHAIAQRAAGDARTLNQLMADTLVERVTGQARADAVPVEVRLVVTPETLLSGGTLSGGTVSGSTVPGWLEGFGPVDAEHARDIVAGAPVGTPPVVWCDEHRGTGNRTTGDRAAGEPSAGGRLHSPTALASPPAAPPQLPPEGELARDLAIFYGASAAPVSGAAPADHSPPEHAPSPHPLPSSAPAAATTPPAISRARAWIRRILTDPITGIATDLDRRRRLFDGTVRELILTRDRHCRHPFCSAPARHADHVIPYARNNNGSHPDNAQALCERGNYAKELRGWSSRRGSTAAETIVTTPTGHRYRTSAPAQIGLPATTERLDAAGHREAGSRTMSA